MTKTNVSDTEHGIKKTWPRRTRPGLVFYRIIFFGVTRPLCSLIFQVLRVVLVCSVCRVIGNAHFGMIGDPPLEAHCCGDDASSHTLLHWFFLLVYYGALSADTVGVAFAVEIHTLFGRVIVVFVAAAAAAAAVATGKTDTIFTVTHLVVKVLVAAVALMEVVLSNL